MKLSLVIPTIGRPNELLRFIRHLESQEGERAVGDVELIVVDQSGRPETREMLATIQTRFPVRHFNMPGRGASRARNYGWSFATGEFITFPDDDCYYPPSLLKSVLHKLEGLPIDCLMIQVEHLGRQDQVSGAVTRENVLFRCVESGMFLRRLAAADLRYDELMGVGADTPWNADEGPDLLIRMLARGLRIEYEPSLLIHHPNPLATLDESLQRRCFAYSRGRGYLLRKHGFPVSTIVRTMIRSLGGSMLMAISGKLFWARYYWNSFLGKLLGLMAGSKANQESLTASQAEIDGENSQARTACDPLFAMESDTEITQRGGH